MPTPYQIILCTCPDKDSAETLAHLLVNQHLSACVNILPGISSIYWWQGQSNSAQEFLLLIKAHKDHYQAIESCIKAHHPYELPEIIAVSIDNGLPEYLHWIDSCHSHI
jgi:periplasmic divalent cation tolerance protein